MLILPYEGDWWIFGLSDIPIFGHANSLNKPSIVILSVAKNLIICCGETIRVIGRLLYPSLGREGKKDLTFQIDQSLGKLVEGTTKETVPTIHLLLSFI